MRAALASLAFAVAGCGDGGGDETSSEGSSGSATSSGATGTSTGGSSSDSTTRTGSSGSEGSSTGRPPVAACERIGLSLVINRQTPIYGLQRRALLASFLDDVVLKTGAELVIHPNTGSETPPTFDCALDPQWASGEAFAWGADFVVDEGAHGRLDCILDGIRDSPSGSDADGDYMFSGLMFPVLADNGWPLCEADVALAMLLSGTDDAQGGMYARPGMASEAFLRLARSREEQRIEAMTFGRDADELPTFAVSVGAASRFYDWDEDDFDAALQDFSDVVQEACATAVHPAPPTADCTQIDILVVVDGSLSMDQEQEALTSGAFSAFTDALETNVHGLQDFRVGVIGAQPGDILLHTHTDFPAVPPSDQTSCGLDPATPWLVGPSPTLAADFACLAATAASEFTETTALNAALALDQQTNPGFVRDDSLVVVIMVTDEDTQSAAVTRMDIRQRVLDAVDGDLSRLFVVGLVGDQGVFEMPKTTCTGPYGTASPGRRLTSVVRSFRERGHVEDICQDAMTNAFDAIAQRVIATCE